MEACQQALSECTVNRSHPRNRPSKSPAIDIAAYPHILDSVVDFAPRSSLLALRATCSALRDRVDAILGRHLIFTSYAEGNVQGRDGRLPALCGYEEFRHTKLERVLRHVRVADVIGPSGLPELRGLQMGSMMDLDMLRLRHHPAGRLPGSVPFIAPTLITFTTFMEIAGAQDQPAIAEVGPVYDGMEHFILNLRYDPGRSWMPQAYIPPFGRPKSLKRVTIIFTEKTTHQEEEVWFRQATKSMGILNSIVLGMTMSIPKGVEYAFVDVQTLRPEWLGTTSDGSAIPRDDPEAIERAIVSSVAAQCKKWERYSDEEAYAAASRIKFMTRQEYRSLVGEERFALETME